MSSSQPSINAISASTAGSHNDLNMVNPSMPEIHAEQAKAPLKDSLAYEVEIPPVPARTRISNANLKVTIPIKKKVAIVEIPDPNSEKPIIAEYQAPSNANDNNIQQMAEDFWKKCHKAQIRAAHPSFANKYTIKVELFDADSQSLGTLESGAHHNPGNCFFCLDYLPENYKVNKDLKVGCITPYCSCFPKTIYEATENSKSASQRLGQVRSVMCSNKINIYDREGKLSYSLKDGNSLLRKFRFLVEVPFVFFCLPYKLAVCCCLDSFWTNKTNKIKLYDHSTKKDVVVGVTTNRAERTNEWQEVVRDGQKVSQYKGEEIFMSKQFEVNMPQDASDELKKLIIGALIAEMPSTIDRCAC